MRSGRLRRRKPGRWSGSRAARSFTMYLGEKPVVLIGDTATRTVRAYALGDKRFSALASEGSEILRIKDAGGKIWNVTEDALVGPGGKRLERLPGHIGYWFAWQNFRAGQPVAERSSK